MTGFEICVMSAQFANMLLVYLRGEGERGGEG
jgi:hypothetical protein